MKVTTKRFCILALDLILFIMGIAVPINKATAAITYNNTQSASLLCSVNSGGQLSAGLEVTGIKGKTTMISTELYVEKRVLLVFWKRISIGYPNDLWTDSVNSFLYSNTFFTNLSSAGTYRVTVTYTVSGSGGSDDVITKTQTVTY